MKICKDCVHYHDDAGAKMCIAIPLGGPNLVSGKIYYTHCFDARTDKHKCGPAGIYFKPAATLTRLVAQFFKRAPTTK